MADGWLSVEEVYAATSPSSQPLSAHLVDSSQLQCELWEYQRQTVAWAIAREQAELEGVGVRGGVLAEEMGLGKTVEIMALILSHMDPSSDPPHEWSEGGTHPLFPGELRPRPAVNSVCGSCGRRPLAQETMHFSRAAGRACCQWCFLPQLPRRERGEVAAGPSRPRVCFEGSKADRLTQPRSASCSSLHPPPVAPHTASSPPGSSHSPPRPSSGFKIRVKRPRPDGQFDEERLARVGCTLIVTPASILSQWLQELQRHSPALAARTVVYSGMRELGKQHGVEGLMRAMEKAVVVLTTYKVLKSEVWYEGAAEASPKHSDRLRVEKRYALPRSPLLERTFWRVAIDEAQMVQTKRLLSGGTPSMLAAMTGRVAALHRWCVTGTPLSPERGVVDGFQLLRFLKCTHPLATDATSFLAATRREESGPLLGLLHSLMRRTSKTLVAAQLGMLPPQQHSIQLSISCAERAWAARDASEMGIPLEQLPPPRHPEVLQEPLAKKPRAANEDGSPVCTHFELQRAFTHVQLSRSWTGLGRSEAQIETGTTVAPLELMQRCAELIQRKKQLAELELAEKLNEKGSLHTALAALGHPDEREHAVGAYERVLRVFEWGVAETKSAGDQVDNAPETLRRWWAEQCHALFRLLCLHHDSGRGDAAFFTRAELDKAEEEYLRDTKLARRARHFELRTHRLTAVLPQLLQLASLWAAVILGPPPQSLDFSLLDRPEGELDEPAVSCVELLAASGEANLELLSSTLDSVSRGGTGRPPIGWLAKHGLAPLRTWLARVEQMLVRARADARASLEAAEEEAGMTSSPRASLPTGAREVEHSPADGTRVSRAPERRGGGGVVDFWDVAQVEEQRLTRERRARAMAHAQLHSGDVASARQARKLELKFASEAELEALMAEHHSVRQLAKELHGELRTEDCSIAADVLAECMLLLKMLQQEVRLRLAASSAALEDDSASIVLEEHKIARDLVGEGDGESRESFLRSRLREVELFCARQTDACLEMERQVKELYRQRLAECLADRASLRYANTAHTHSLSCNSPLGFTALVASLPGSLQPLLVPSGEPRAQQHAHAVALAPHSCAVALTMRLALQEWLWRRITEAQPAGSFSPAEALFGSSPQALEHKLEVVKECVAAAHLGTSGAEERVAQWLLRTLPQAEVVPYRVARRAAEAGSFRLPCGSAVHCVKEVLDRKPTIFDGEVSVEGKYDGEVSGASYESGPWVWEESARVWRRDVHPHEVLVSTQCGHAYSEAFWSDAISTTLEQKRAGSRWMARKARCCAPVEGGGQCGHALRETQGLRITSCLPRVAQSSLLSTSGSGVRDTESQGFQMGEWGFQRVDLQSLSHCAVRGAWGSRIEQAVRLLISLRTAANLVDKGAAKAVVFSRFEPTLRLLTRACLMNGMRCAMYDASKAQNDNFREDDSLQVLLLSAHRDASGLTLTAASHVIIMEPQPDVAVELQMIGRVHRIGQKRQTHVYRILVADSFEEHIVGERQERWHRSSP